MLRETNLSSDKESSVLNPLGGGSNTFNFDQDVNQYTKLINILYNQNNKQLFNMK